jgi:hypothetical protein
MADLRAAKELLQIEFGGFRKFAMASGMFSPCVVEPVSGLRATKPPSSAGISTAVKSTKHRGCDTPTVNTRHFLTADYADFTD